MIILQYADYKYIITILIVRLFLTSSKKSILKVFGQGKCTKTKSNLLMNTIQTRMIRKK